MRLGAAAVLGAAAALAGPVWLSAQGPAQAELRWGGDAEGGAPFVEADPRDPSKFDGFDVAIAAEIARGLGRTPRFVQVQWDQIDAAVARGDFDIGMSGVEDRPGRRARFLTTIPYFEFREVLTVREADRDRFRTLADLRRHRVGTLGSTMAYELLLEARGTHGIEPISYDDDVHPYTDLLAGRLDGVLLDHIAVLVDRLRDGTLEGIFRRWDVWDSQQAEFQARMVKLADAELARAAASAWCSSSIICSIT